MVEAHTARVLLSGMAGSSQSRFDHNDPPCGRSQLRPMLVAKQLVLRTSSGEKVDEEYAADLRDKMKAPKASATNTIRNSQGDEITGDYALALRKKFRRRVELGTMPIPGSSKEKTVDMLPLPFMETTRQVQLENNGGERTAAVTCQCRDVSMPWVKPRGSVAEELRSRSLTTKDTCSRVAEVACHSMAEDVEETIMVEWTNEETIADLLAMTKKRLKMISPHELTVLYVFDDGWLLLDMNQRTSAVLRGGESLLAAHTNSALALGLCLPYIPNR